MIQNRIAARDPVPVIDSCDIANRSSDPVVVRAPAFLERLYFACVGYFAAFLMEGQHLVVELLLLVQQRAPKDVKRKLVEEGPETSP